MEAVRRKMARVQVTQRQIRAKLRKLWKDAAQVPDGITPRFLQQVENSWTQETYQMTGRQLMLHPFSNAIWETIDQCP
jgi:hypothetical protein